MTLIRIIMMLTIISTTSCGGTKTSTNQLKPQSSASNRFRPVNSLPPQLEETIRTVDFKNFVYPVCPSIRREILSKSKDISLRNGELEIPRGVQGNEDPIDFSLSNVAYHDLTGDDKEEAIVTLTSFLYPHGSSNCTFI